ncbi:hypothetical protein E2562_013066 [Oryza meyeriana var. granulata]|uniref:Uncharacterized protein n=1 Tax=Oryza meyeriana var. granulata TaxID=110450 RepID=A0A6G1DIX4_9ORYZ|nr:hypothetical protein E2562_013066 [Oryza meyeriana var. granulata]
MLLQRQLAAPNGQAPVQGLVMADNGQASSVQRPPPAAFNGQGPDVQGPHVASNGQMSSMQRRSTAYNYQYQMQMLL